MDDRESGIEKKTFFGTPVKAFIFITCVVAVISFFIIGTVFATTLIVRSSSNSSIGDGRAAVNNESVTAKDESMAENNESFAADSEGMTAGSGTNIGVDEAQSIAANHAGFSVSEVNFSKAKLEKEHRQMVYEIEFYQDGMEYEYEIDAQTGDIIKYESGWDD